MKEKADFLSLGLFLLLVFLGPAPLPCPCLHMRPPCKGQGVNGYLWSLPGQNNVSQGGPDEAIMYILQTAGTRRPDPQTCWLQGMRALGWTLSLFSPVPTCLGGHVPRPQSVGKNPRLQAKTRLMLLFLSKSSRHSESVVFHKLCSHFCWLVFDFYLA